MARTVGACANLTEEALQVVLLQPLGRRLEALCTDRRRDASGRRAGAVTVEILMHL